MSVLDDDIMTIDEATGRWYVAYHNMFGIREILRTPGHHPANYSTTLIGDYPERVADSIKKYLERVPIMDLTDERIENILRGHVAEQSRCWFFGPGHPRQLNRENNNHWELVYKKSKYSKPASIAVYPLYECQS